LLRPNEGSPGPRTSSRRWRRHTEARTTWGKDCKGAGMLHLDLEAAGIPYAAEGPDGPLFADFHSLRHI